MKILKFILLLVLFFILSAVFPYCFAYIKETVERYIPSFLTKSNIQLVDYIQITSTLFSFLTATLISTLVYIISISGANREKKRSVYFLSNYIRYCTKNIRSVCDKTSNINLLSRTSEVSTCIFQLKLKDTEIDSIVEILDGIEQIIIAKDQGKDNLDQLCHKFLEDYEEKKLLIAKIDKMK